MCFGIISLDLISLLLLFGIKYIISEESSFGPTFLINVYKFGRVEAEVSKLLEKLPLKQAEGLCWLLQCWAFSAETSININNRYLQCCWRERERERERELVCWLRTVEAQLTTVHQHGCWRGNSASVFKFECYNLLPRNLSY